MIKNILYSLLMVLVCFNAFSQKSGKYSIAGKISGIESGIVFMKQKDGNAVQVIDSARIINGKFAFKGKISGVESVDMIFNKERQKLTVFLEPGKINVTAKRDSIYYGKVSGTPNNERWGNYLREQKHLEKEEMRQAELYKQSFETKDRTKVRAAQNAFAAATENLKKLKADFLVNPENKYVALYYYRSALMLKLEFEALDSIVTGLEKDHVLNNDYKLMAERRDLMRGLAAGQQIEDIQLPGTDGEIIRLSSLRGKWVLIDFWASWCAPCRNEGKHVLELYNIYNPKGFEVFGVSIDTDRNAWGKAIQDDGTHWKHVIDAKGDVARKFGIVAIPRVLLIDPQGVITDVNIRGEKLTQKLKTIWPE